jgi:hypothetical protein
MEGGVVEGKNGWVDSFTCKGPLATDSNDWYVLTLLSTGMKKEGEKAKKEWFSNKVAGGLGFQLLLLGTTKRNR